MFEHVERDALKDREVVRRLQRLSHDAANLIDDGGLFGPARDWARSRTAAALKVDDGRVKLFLGGEVAEDDGLRDARGLRNLLGGSAAKAALGEEAHRDLCNLPATLVGAHAR